MSSGNSFAFSAWVNDRYLGFNQGAAESTYTWSGGIDLTNDTYTFNPADLNVGDNVVTVLIESTGEAIVGGFDVEHADALCRARRDVGGSGYLQSGPSL